MDERTILIAAFVCGVAIQATVLLRGDWNWPKICGSVFVGLVVTAWGSDKPNYNQDWQMYQGLLVFSFTFALFFKEDILPAVSEKLLLSYTLTFWFAFFAYYFKGTPQQIGVLCVCIVPTIATIVLAFKRTALNTFWKIAFYTWFLCVIVELGLLGFSFSQLSIFYVDRNLPWITPVDSLLAGMAFLYLLVNATYIYYLVPIPGKGQSWESRMKDWHEFTDLMVQRFDGNQPSYLVTMLILCVQGGILLLNYFLHLLSNGLLISIFILLPGVFLSIKPSPRFAPAGTETAAPERVPHSRHLKKVKQRSKDSL
jgi:hypothetical protein